MKRNELLRMAIYAIILLVLGLFLLDAFCDAEPYIVYQPTINIVKYQIEIDGQVSDVDPNVVNDNTMMLVYDLANLEIGAHSIRARAIFELWGPVEWSETFTVIRPGPLENPQLTTNP